jgi:hypothetical protein
MGRGLDQSGLGKGEEVGDCEIGKDLLSFIY